MKLLLILGSGTDAGDEILADTIASICPRIHIFFIYPSVCFASTSLRHLTNHEKHAHDLDPGEFDLRTITLIHDLVHYVSYWEWSEFTANLRPPVTARKIVERFCDRVNDIDALEFSKSGSPNDDAALDAFHDNADDYMVYDHEALKQLASLENDAVASLGNADSYACFALQGALTYLKEHCVGQKINNVPKVKPGPKSRTGSVLLRI